MGSDAALSEAAANIVENLACRIAERCRGRITASQLMPYLPMSLKLVRSCLENMVDGSSVLSEKSEHVTEFEFAADKDSEVNPGVLSDGSCVSCGADMFGGGQDALCSACSGTLRGELNALAEKTGWPAQAVYEHEILYQAADHKGPVHAETLAAHSPYTLRNMRRKLDKMSLEGYLSQELDQDAGMMTYCFPEMDYPKNLYRKNMAVIRGYPSSVMEEVQIKVARILFTLGAMFLGMLVLAFLRVPFPILIVLFFVTAPIVAIVMWRHRSRPEEE